MLTHTYRTPSGSNGRCGVEMLRSDGRLIVMLTELPDNTGTSITNCFDLLATSIVRVLTEFNLVSDPGTVRWIEHYARSPADQSSSTLDDWDEVLMEWDGRQYHAPTWKPFNGDRYRKPVLGDPCHEQFLSALFDSQ